MELVLLRGRAGVRGNGGGCCFGLQRPRGLRLSDRRWFVYVAQWIRFQTDVGMAGRIYLEEGGGMCLYACLYVCVSVFTSVGLVDRGSWCVYISVKLSVLIKILEPGWCLEELLCQ